MKRKLKIRTQINNILITLIIICALLTTIYISVSAFFYEEYTMRFYHLFIILIISIILTTIYKFFFRINNIHILMQIVFIYASFAISSYIMCYLLLPIPNNNWLFFIFSAIISIIGLAIIIFVVLFKEKRENEEINKDLKKFKERGKK